MRITMPDTNILDEPGGRYVALDDTPLYVVERGSGYPIIVLHGGQGLSGMTTPDTWTIGQMAADVVALARALGFERYAVLGHSYGAFVALQNAVDHPGQAAQSIVSSGVRSVRWLADLEEKLAAFEPEDLRAQVRESWERESS